jgi:hypothetical protein
MTLALTEQMKNDFDDQVRQQEIKDSAEHQIINS